MIPPYFWERAGYLFLTYRTDMAVENFLNRVLAIAYLQLIVASQAIQTRETETDTLADNALLLRGPSLVRRQVLGGP